MGKILEIRHLIKSYTKKKKKILILDNIDYQFFTNTFYCIIGKSGAGKTTLIEVLGLLKSFDEGEILIDNKNISLLNDKQKSNIRNKKIGFIFQSFYLIPSMTALENVMLPMYLDKSKNKKAIEEAALRLLKKMDLEDRRMHYPSELSGGEQQRIAIARALINNPEIILADEPTGSLDPENEEKILKILKELAQSGKCVIVVSHNKRTMDYADEIIKIQDGGLERCIKS